MNNPADREAVLAEMRRYAEEWVLPEGSTSIVSAVGNWANALSQPAASGVVTAGCVMVEESSLIPHFHPAYGDGMFFTKDCILATQPPAREN